MKNRTKTISLLMALCMMLTLLPAVALAVDYNLWVGGVRVTSENANSITGTGITGTVSYDAFTNTLTLNNAKITGHSAYEGIRTQGTALTVNLVGSNEVIGQDNNGSSNYGMYIRGALTFTGSGSLKASAESGYFSVAILATGDITVGGDCTITATCGTGTVTAPIYPYTSYALILNGANVTASENANGENAVSCSDFSYNNLKLYKYLNIKPGTGGTSGGSTTPTTYTVSFDANGGTGFMATASDVSGEYTLPPNGFIAPTNKQFKCWSVEGVEKNPSDVITVSGNVTVTAVWEDKPETYYVHFMPGYQGNAGSMEDQEFTEGISEILKANAFTNPGYSFIGWDKVEKSGIATYTDGQEITLTKAIMGNNNTLTLYAQWKDSSMGGGNNNSGGGNTPTTYEKEYNNFIVTGPVNSTGDGVEGIVSTANGLDIKAAGEYTVKNVNPSTAHSQMIRVLAEDVTLTLAGVNVDKNSDNALRLEADTNIVLENQNTLDGNGNGISAESNGKAEYTVTFSGSGSLTAVGTGNGIHGHAVIESGNVTCEGGGNGIHGNVEMKGGTVTATGKGDADSGGIRGNVTMTGGTLNCNGAEMGYNPTGANGIIGEVTISAGTLRSVSENRNGILGKVTINGGEVYCEGKNDDGQTTEEDKGANGIEGNVEMSGGTLIAYCSDMTYKDYFNNGYAFPGVIGTITFVNNFAPSVLVGENDTETSIASGFSSGGKLPDKYVSIGIGGGSTTPTPPDDDATISGTITSPYGNITVKLVSLDGTEYAGTIGAVTQENGKYSCTYTAKAPKGYNYNVVVTAEDSSNNNSVTVTELVYLSGDSTCDIKLPEGEKNSIVDDNSENFNAIVGGVEKIAGGDTTNLNITITLEINDVTANDDGADAIKKKAVDMDLDFVDFSLFKQVGDGETKDIGSENKVLLTIMLKYDTNRRNIRVFRYHEGVDELESINENNQSEGFWIGNGYIGIRAKKFSTYAVAYDSPSPGGAPGTVAPGTSSGGYSGPSIWYIGGNTFGTSTSQVPTSVEIDNVPVPFTMNGSNIVVGCVAPDADRIRVTWGSVSNSIGFTPDAAASCAQVFVPKTGDVSVMAFALMAVIAAAGAMGKK